MNPLDARYPFFESARTAVETAEISLPELVSRGAPAVERGRERVQRALLEGTVRPETDDVDPETELLSYPIARILVSLLDSTAAIDKYAAAEASTAIERIREDVAREDDLRSTQTTNLDLDDVLAEFDLADDVQPDDRSHQGHGEQWYRIDVGAYLSLSSSSWGREWRLVARELDEGEVRITGADLFELLETAIRDRIAAGLPFDLPREEGLGAELEPQVTDLRGLLSDRTRVHDIDVVAPELFPPCLRNLIDKAERGTELSSVEGFSLMAFLAGIGMSADEIVAFCADTSLEVETLRYQLEYLRDESGSQYPPPSCETLSAYGICHNEDDHWKVASHPLAYYETRVEEVDSDAITDWRATTNA
ncbi:DNA primase large subunit PriL [Halalkaliarchaeum desulfuricum]|nr:DNA primase large subunit PriL [Halalkaliarchaeum desulfuricum]